MRKFQDIRGDVFKFGLLNSSNRSVETPHLVVALNSGNHYFDFKNQLNVNVRILDVFFNVDRLTVGFLADSKRYVVWHVDFPTEEVTLGSVTEECWFKFAQAMRDLGIQTVDEAEARAIILYPFLEKFLGYTSGHSLDLGLTDQIGHAMSANCKSGGIYIPISLHSVVVAYRRITHSSSILPDTIKSVTTQSWPAF